jgi:transcriptional regulator with XRE-family HTH domain/predicted RNA methylase
MTSALHLGDCLEVLRTMADASVDAVVTDPPYGLSFMGKKWDYDVPSVAIWAECLRVLKPGGHLLAFAGTRTQHRMAVRIEDAGFEIRDMIAWVYGSGFPKSLDVSKAIDKHGGQSVAWFGPWFRNWREAQGINQKQVAALFPSKTGNLTGCVANWELGFNMPTPEQFNLIRDAFKLPFDSIQAAEREVVGQHETDMGGLGGERLGQKGGDITAPATPEAQQWAGWGTAIKPSFEPVTVARKPLGGRTVAANVLEFGTGAINVDACRIKPSIAPGGREWEEQRNRAFLSAAIAALSDKLTELEHCLSIAVEAAGPTTSAKAASPQPATCRPVTGCCDGTKTGSTSTSSSTGEFGRMPTAQSLTDIASIIETASRQTIDWATWNLCQCPSTSAITSASITAALKSLRLAASNSSNAGTAGRWPSNLIHDGSDEVVGLFPQTTTGSTGGGTNKMGGTFGNGKPTISPFREGDTGSAARFFYTAKASRDDRDPGNTHPTVKPTDLMRYLCRLVTPPGGVVLDPFAGSGSTGKAAELEGFDSILIEQDPASYAIAKQRISRAQAAGHQPDLFASAGPVA